MNYKWPLGVSNMTFFDKLKISKFLFIEKQWTAGSYIERYEKKWSEYTGCSHVIMVSSGSTANELIALKRKYELKEAGLWPQNNKVLVSAVNWISSISPWVNYEFEPVFTDVGHNLCATVSQIKAALEKDDSIKTVFYTTLLGYSCDLLELHGICNSLGVKLLLDNCESSFSSIQWKDNERYTNINNLLTSSTSLYISHFTSGSQEGGLIFCQNKDEADWYRMARNHGMTRGLDQKYRNWDVNSDFDFYMTGSNYRSSNLLAYMHLLDFDRALDFSVKYRKQLSDGFCLNRSKFEDPHAFFYGSHGFIPLSIPIITNKKWKDEMLIHKVKDFLLFKNIGFRPIVGGNMLRQTAFKKYGKPEDFPISDHVHFNGIYLGLHAGVTYDMVENLANDLNKL